MRFVELLLRLVESITPSKLLAQKVMKILVLNNWSRNILNNVYLKLSFGSKRAFHTLFAKIFRNSNIFDIHDSWKIRFNSQWIEIPLSGHSLWLDWDTGLSVVGHDVEIKSFYERLLNSDFRPQCFYDIGANYGTHLLLFLANSVHTISFEPNINCNLFLNKLLKFNDLDPNIENIALSDEIGESILMFPEKDTLGSLTKHYQERFKDYEDVQYVRTPIITLDVYCANKTRKPDLIKIDTEGYELHVLRGGEKTIASTKPLIIFECNETSLRVELKSQFDILGYYIYDLKKLYTPLNADRFTKSKSTIFLAIPKSHNLNNKDVMSKFLGSCRAD